TLRSVETNFVSVKGVTPVDCRRFCAEKASDFNKSQQPSTRGLQQVQYQSLKNNKFQQVSTRVAIWFGTRGSEVQILSPRPFIFSDLQPSGENQSRPTWSWARCSSFRIGMNAALRAYGRVHDHLKIDYPAG